MAPTNVTFPLSPSGEIIPYNYSVGYSPVKDVDVLGKFIESCQAKKIRTGFYYTVASNTWLNVESGFVNHLVPLCSSIDLLIIPGTKSVAGSGTDERHSSHLQSDRSSTTERNLDTIWQTRRSLVRWRVNSDILSSHSSLFPLDILSH